MPLRAHVYVAPPIPWSKSNGQEGGVWSPISCTLIHSDTEAVLVDTPITMAQTSALADWIDTTLSSPTNTKHTPKRLTTIYITHGHGDHWFGLRQLLERYPGCRAIATQGTIAHMHEQASPSAFKASWGTQFPNQVDTNFTFASPLPSNGEFSINNGTHLFRAIDVGHSDTHDSTILWVPDLALAVCGDVVYGDVHQMLGAANTAALRSEWIRAIETVEALGPRVVVPGHKKAGEVDGVWHLQASKQYIRDFGELVESGKAKNARDLARLMLELYPSRFNQGALLMGCVNVFKVMEKEKPKARRGPDKL